MEAKPMKDLEKENQELRAMIEKLKAALTKALETIAAMQSKKP